MSWVIIFANIYGLHNRSQDVVSNAAYTDKVSTFGSNKNSVVLTLVSDVSSDRISILLRPFDLPGEDPFTIRRFVLRVTY